MVKLHASWLEILYIFLNQFFSNFDMSSFTVLRFSFSVAKACWLGLVNKISLVTLSKLILSNISSTSPNSLAKILSAFLFIHSISVCFGLFRLLTDSDSSQDPQYSLGKHLFDICVIEREEDTWLDCMFESPCGRLTCALTMTLGCWLGCLNFNSHCCGGVHESLENNTSFHSYKL